MNIQLQSIQKKFGQLSVLDTLDLNIESGELIALLGPSGCGKTTLMRIIAGLERADHGRVLFDGEDISHKHLRERHVGFVFQHYALFKHMTVFDNIAFGLQVRPKSVRLSKEAIEARVMSLLKLVQLEPFSKRYPAQLSGGQRQRVALARALAVEPKILLLDEPFGALDAKVRQDLRRWLRKLHDELHITSLFVTHDQEEAMEVADRIVVLNQGKIEQQGTPEEIYKAPATAFVYNFIGSVNQFHGYIESEHFHVGKELIPISGYHKTTGQVCGYSRPHELQIIGLNETRIGFSATIERVIQLGENTKVELNSQINSHDHFYEVVMPNAKFQQLNVQCGQGVKLVPSKITFY